MYMIDGVYQSIIAFFMVYCLFAPATFNTVNGLGLDDTKRMGVYIATIAVLSANLYILINTYRWDWLMIVIVAISSLLVWFWTGVYTSTTGSAQFYKAGAQVYGSLSFWAVLLLATVVCLLPRFVVKVTQKVYFPYDVDIIREQVREGHFDYLKETDAFIPPPPEKVASMSSSDVSKSKKKAVDAPVVEDDMRPIYPPSVAPTAGTHNPRSQNGSNSTDYTFRRSLDTIPNRISLDRPRPSYDRARVSMDRVRPSFEASNDFTSAALLTRIESSQSQTGQRTGQLSRLRHALSTRRPTVSREEAPEQSK
jgi:phospholipid-translocating ATPase